MDQMLKIDWLENNLWPKSKMLSSSNKPIEQSEMFQKFHAFANVCKLRKLSIDGAWLEWRAVFSSGVG